MDIRKVNVDRKAYSLQMCGIIGNCKQSFPADAKHLKRKLYHALPRSLRNTNYA